MPAAMSCRKSYASRTYHRGAWKLAEAPATLAGPWRYAVRVANRNEVHNAMANS